VCIFLSVFIPVFFSAFVWRIKICIEDAWRHDNKRLANVRTRARCHQQCSICPTPRTTDVINAGKNNKPKHF